MDFEIKEESNLIGSDTDLDDIDLDDEDEHEADDDYKEELPRKSYVWRYFRKLEDSDSCECVICNATVGNLVSNLARHLAGAHNISRDLEAGKDNAGRGRPSRSFIWKYCTRENPKQALCHLCNKLLFFGGGNTSNIAKHLRRKHSDVLDAKEMGPYANINDTTRDTINGDNKSPSEIKNERKDRRGGSYVWNYCVKLSKDTVHCKLCNKKMSFHGTANVITHLARKHGIVGSVTGIKEGQELPIIPLEDSELNTTGARRGRGSTAPCSVWRYCKRLSKEVVRCGFCKKNLSFQGTSNLQRHLHRMHGIAPQPRPNILDDSNFAEDNINTDIWEHCTILEDEKAKCNMCDQVMEVEMVQKHMTQTHAIEPIRRNSRETMPTSYDLHYESSEQGENDKDLIESCWSKSQEDAEADYIPELNENTKKDYTLYDDMIEIDNNAEEDISNDEDIIESNMPITIDANPLSPPSSADEHNFNIMKRKKFLFTKRMQELYEERTRMETEYFREKAGFYKMQKYLTALQAKKVKLELEQISQNTLNSAVAPSYTVNASALTENIT